MSSSMHGKLVFTVEDSFYIDKRGVMLVGNCLAPEVSLLPKQQLQLVLPNGSARTTEIIGVDYFTKCFSEHQAMGVLVSLQTKEQALLGTKVYVR